MLDSIYHMTKSQSLRFCHINMMLLWPSLHSITKICKTLRSINFNSWHYITSTCHIISSVGSKKLVSLIFTFFRRDKN